MKYIALYRKLRPQKFDDVISQQHIIKTLKNQIENDRIVHAYLFCGTRGTGKTSTAKIFAKIINCENKNGAYSCEKCASCISFNKNSNLDIIEIDAASNNGIEDIREIREEIKYPPTNSKYKVYIIDEVHMLSIGAFNALLKTLEEPPSHVVFILATTDAHKIPITILSRCQRFDFKRINIKEMMDSIKNYTNDMNINITDDALHYICKISDGAMRDALSVLDQCISFYYKEEITLNKVLDILGAVDDDVFFRFTNSLCEFNQIDTLDIINKISNDGRDIPQFIMDCTKHFRDIIIASSSCENIFDISNEKYEKIKSQAKNIDTTHLIKIIEEFSSIQARLKYSFDEKILLETSCIKLCNVFDEKDMSDILQRIKYLEKKLENTDQNIVYVEKKDEPKYIQKSKEIKEKYDDIEIEELKYIKTKYEKFKSAIKDEAIRSFMQNSEPKMLNDCVLYIIISDLFIDSILLHKDMIKNIANSIFDKNYNIKFITKKDFDKIKSKKDYTDDDKNADDKEENTMHTIAESINFDEIEKE